MATKEPVKKVVAKETVKAETKAVTPVKAEAKKEDVKAPAKKATATKTAAKKAPAKKATATKTAAKKAPAKKATATKTAAKKTTAKKTTTAKKATTTKAATKKAKNTVVAEFEGFSIDVTNIIDEAKKAYVAQGHKATEAKEIAVYVNQGGVYAVVNGESIGKIK